MYVHLANSRKIEWCFVLGKRVIVESAAQDNTIISYGVLYPKSKYSVFALTFPVCLPSSSNNSAALLLTLQIAVVVVKEVVSNETTTPLWM